MLGVRQNMLAQKLMGGKWQIMNKPDVISTEYMVSALANDTCATFWIYYTLEANRVFSEVNTICVTLYKALKQVTSQLWQSYIQRLKLNQTFRLSFWITKWNIIWMTKCLGICYEKTKTKTQDFRVNSSPHNNQTDFPQILRSSLQKIMAWCQFPALKQSLVELTPDIV